VSSQPSFAFEDEEEYQSEMMIISGEAVKPDVDWAPG
jgi:hypothetical protein